MSDVTTRRGKGIDSTFEIIERGIPRLRRRMNEPHTVEGVIDNREFQETAATPQNRRSRIYRSTEFSDWGFYEGQVGVSLV